MPCDCEASGRRWALDFLCTKASSPGVEGVGKENCDVSVHAAASDAGEIDEIDAYGVHRTSYSTTERETPEEGHARRLFEWSLEDAEAARDNHRDSATSEPIAQRQGLNDPRSRSRRRQLSVLFHTAQKLVERKENNLPMKRLEDFFEAFLANALKYQKSDIVVALQRTVTVAGALTYKQYEALFAPANLEVEACGTSSTESSYVGEVIGSTGLTPRNSIADPLMTRREDVKISAELLSRQVPFICAPDAPDTLVSASADSDEDDTLLARATLMIWKLAIDAAAAFASPEASHGILMTFVSSIPPSWLPPTIAALGLSLSRHASTRAQYVASAVGLLNHLLSKGRIVEREDRKEAPWIFPRTKCKCTDCSSLSDETRTRVRWETRTVVNLMSSLSSSCFVPQAADSHAIGPLSFFTAVASALAQHDFLLRKDVEVKGQWLNSLLTDCNCESRSDVQREALEDQQLLLRFYSRLSPHVCAFNAALQLCTQRPLESGPSEGCLEISPVRRSRAIYSAYAMTMAVNPSSSGFTPAPQCAIASVWSSASRASALFRTAYVLGCPLAHQRLQMKWRKGSHQSVNKIVLKEKLDGLEEDAQSLSRKSVELFVDALEEALNLQNNEAIFRSISPFGCDTGAMLAALCLLLHCGTPAHAKVQCRAHRSKAGQEKIASDISLGEYVRRLLLSFLAKYHDRDMYRVVDRALQDLNDVEGAPDFETEHSIAFLLKLLRQASAQRLASDPGYLALSTAWAYTERALTKTVQCIDEEEPPLFQLNIIHEVGLNMQALRLAETRRKGAESRRPFSPKLLRHLESISKKMNVDLTLGDTDETKSVSIPLFAGINLQSSRLLQ